MLTSQPGKAWSRLIWHRTETSLRLLWTLQWTFILHQMYRTLLPEALLVYQGLCMSQGFHVSMTGDSTGWDMTPCPWGSVPNIANEHTAFIFEGLETQEKCQGKSGRRNTEAVLPADWKGCRDNQARVRRPTKGCTGRPH